MHLYDDIEDALSFLRGSTSSFMINFIYYYKTHGDNIKVYICLYLHVGRFGYSCVCIFLFSFVFIHRYFFLNHFFFNFGH